MKPKWKIEYDKFRDEHDWKQYKTRDAIDDVIVKKLGEIFTQIESDHAAALRQAKIDMADKNTDIITEHLPSGSIMPLWIVRAMNAIHAEAAKE